MVAAKGAPEDARRERRNLSGNHPQGPQRRLRPNSRSHLLGRMWRVWPSPYGKVTPRVSTRTGPACTAATAGAAASSRTPSTDEGGRKQTMVIVGQVESRSSSASFRGGPPGESEIHRLNPKRKQRIRRAMGWESLEPGSLNLRVDRDAVASLAELEAVICERPDEVCYPKKYAHIPQVRGGYKYYSATVTVGHETEPVLVRRAATNPVPRRLELFAAVNLRLRFQLKDDDDVRLTEIGS